MISFLRIDESNVTDFASVLPSKLNLSGKAVIGAYDEKDQVLGAVAVSTDREQYDIDWLYVDPEVRLQGIGKALVKEVKRMIESIGYRPITASFDGNEENGLYAFFVSVSSVDLMIDVSYTYDRMELTTEDFYKSEAMTQRGRIDYVPEYFWDMDEAKRNEMLDLTTGILTITDIDEFEGNCEKRLCLGVYTENGPQAFMLVQKDDDDRFELSYLYSVNSKCLMAILGAAAAEIRRNYKGKQIYFDIVSPEARALADAIFPDAVRIPVYTAEF